MKREELELKLNELENEYILNKKKLIRKFCDANNPYKVGDVFTDHIGSIKVELIRYNYSDYNCVYFGVELKKDGTPKKLNPKRNAWQGNDIKTD